MCKSTLLYEMSYLDTCTCASLHSHNMLTLNSRQINIQEKLKNVFAQTETAS